MQLFEQFKEEFFAILTDGGWLMFPLGLLAIAIYWTAFRLIFYFREHGFHRIKRQKLIEYVFNPIIASGEMRMILDYTQDPEIGSREEIKNRFSEIQNAYLADIDSRRNFLLTMVTIAPLMGLLGTVMGMLTTFAGLAVSGGKTVDLIAAGISEALITTQTGLIIAIPGYVMASMIMKRRNQFEAFLSTTEALTIQLFEKNSNSTMEAQ
jgi:biopolymer transport protein ExbB